MLMQNLVDEVVIRDERVRIVRKRLQTELNLHESDDEEVSEEFQSKLENEVSMLPWKTVPEPGGDTKRE